ncbi:phenylacetate--CoA ligase family protein [Caldalkalibacillus salinus]|uniref:phenylacetate--CoA ligase family protein n=1 Tax=Caldalkalibacillus salinus TaxID=2803787 RepID=UPI001921A0D8|nr:AMP-binding protein [Caldalkalibacillus salinus]
MWRDMIRNVLQTKTGWQAHYIAQGYDLRDVDSRDSFSRLPVLKKQDLPKLQRQSLPFAEFVQTDEVARIFVSPGPIYDPQGEDEDYWRFGPLLDKIGVQHQDVVQNTFSYHLSPAGFMFDQAARSRGAKVIPAGTGHTNLQVDVMRDLQTTVYSGTPSFLMHLLQKAEEKGYRVGRELALQKAVFTAETVTREMEAILNERGIQYIDTYGTADVGAIAYRLQGENHFNVTEDIFLQICDPDTGLELTEGEVGEVVISLSSQVYPLIRFGTGDLSRWVVKDKAIAGMLGRVADSYKVKGMFVHAQQLDEVMNSIREVETYQAQIQHEGGQDVLRIHVTLAGGVPLEHVETHLLPQWTRHVKEHIRVTPTIHISEQHHEPERDKLVDMREA